MLLSHGRMYMHLSAVITVTFQVQFSRRSVRNCNCSHNFVGKSVPWTFTRLLISISSKEVSRLNLLASHLHN